MSDPQEILKIELTVSDPSELRSLREWLSRVRGLAVDQVPGMLEDGELGVGDILTILATSSSGVLAVAIRTLPEFIRSRRTDITVTIKDGKKEYRLQASNADDVSTIIDRLSK